MIRLRMIPLNAIPLIALTLGAALLLPGAMARAEAPLIPVPLVDELETELPEATAGMDTRFDGFRRAAPAAAEPGAGHWIAPLRPTRVSRNPSWPVLRFTGEFHRESFALHVADPRLSNVLRITSQSTVNVLPERSSALVRVNGTRVGSLRMGNLTGFGTQELQLPEGLLRAGRNEVEIEIIQHHRIFCGPDASWALWTDIDLSQSGLSVDPADIEPGPDSFLMGLAAQGVDPVGLEVRGTAHLGAQRTAWIRMLTAQLSNVMGGQPLTYRFTDYWNSLAQQRPARARVTFIPGTRNQIRYRTGADGAQVMVVEYIPESAPVDLEGLGANLAALPQAERPPQVEVGRDVPLTRIGFETERYSQRYAYREFAFRLPDNWLILTAAKARLRLDYIYTEGLPRGSVLILMVNGEPVRMLPLWDEPNRYFEGFPIDFEARLLNAGNNIIGWELLIPGDPPDMPCSGNRGEVLEIGQNSTLNVPYSPSMYLADMGLAFSALTPDSLRRNDLTHRSFSNEDQVVLGAALSRAAAEFGPGVLHLMALEDMGSIPPGGYSVDRRLLEEVLLSHPDAEIDDTDTPARPDPFRFIDESRGYRGALFAWWDWFAGHGMAFSQWLFPRSQDQLNEWLAEQSGKAVFLQLDHHRPEHVWMMRSPDADINRIASAIVVARTHGQGPRGQVSVLDHDGEWHNWLAPDRRPVMLEPWSLSNFRAAMGNVVSANPISLTIMLFSFAVLSAFLALKLVISTREHDP